MNTKTEPCRTLEDAYKQYSDSFPDKAARVGTAILRYLLPYKGFKFDFQIYPKQMLGPEAKAKGMKFLSQIALEDLSEIERVLVWQVEVFDALKASQAIRRPNKHYLKSFLIWCKDQGWLEKPPKEWEVPQSLPEISKAFHRRGGREQQHIYNRQPLIQYGASLKLVSDTVKSQLEEWKDFWTNVNYAGTRPFSKLVELDSHQKLLDRFSYFLGWLTLDKLKYHQQMYDRSQRRKEKDPNYESFWLTVSPDPPDWLQEMHKRYPPRSLNSITLEEFIPIIEIRSDKLQFDVPHSLVEVDSNRDLLQTIQEELKHQNATLSFDTIAKLGQALLGTQAFSEEIIKLNKINEREIAKQKADLLMEEACKHIRSHLKSFFRWLQYQHNPSNSPQGYRISRDYRTSFCDVFLNLAKFFYKDITNPRKSPNYEDIGIISELRSLIKEELDAEFKPNPVNPVKRNPTWSELGNLLKELLVACAPRRKVSSDSDRVSLGPMRRQLTVAVDFQKYLIMQKC